MPLSKMSNFIPKAANNIIQQHLTESIFDEIEEQITNLGYAILNSDYSKNELKNISEKFNYTREHYLKTHDEDTLKNHKEFHTFRAPLTYGDRVFTNLALNQKLLFTLKKLIPGKFILNQQNGVINLPKESYDHGTWHRDLPYQHFVSSKPIVLNAIFCVDDFTIANGATFVIPGSHKSEAFPSAQYVQKHARQIEAKAGSFILIDGMLFHAGGFNQTSSARRAITHVYNIPYFKQQINIPKNMQNVKLLAEEKEILGFNYMEPDSIKSFILKRTGKQY